MGEFESGDGQILYFFGDADFSDEFFAAIEYFLYLTEAIEFVDEMRHGGEFEDNEVGVDGAGFYVFPLVFQVVLEFDEFFIEFDIIFGVFADDVLGEQSKISCISFVEKFVIFFEFFELDDLGYLKLGLVDVEILLDLFHVHVSGQSCLRQMMDD